MKKPNKKKHRSLLPTIVSDTLLTTDYVKLYHSTEYIRLVKDKYGFVKGWRRSEFDIKDE